MSIHFILLIVLSVFISLSLCLSLSLTSTDTCSISKSITLSLQTKEMKGERQTESLSRNRGIQKSGRQTAKPLRRLTLQEQLENPNRESVIAIHKNHNKDEWDKLYTAALAERAIQCFDGPLIVNRPPHVLSTADYREKLRAILSGRMAKAPVAPPTHESDNVLPDSDDDEGILTFGSADKPLVRGCEIVYASAVCMSIHFLLLIVLSVFISLSLCLSLTLTYTEFDK